jgi:hypothetical protein
MYKSPGSKSLVILAVTVLGISTAQRVLNAQGTPVPGRNVAPQTVLAADAVDPLRFAAALARDGVPAGFVISVRAVADDQVTMPIEPPGHLNCLGPVRK